MIDIIKDLTERAQAEKEKWMAFGELVSYLCRQHEHLEYEIELFVISPEGVALETPSEIIQYHIDAEHRSETVKILCTIEPYGYTRGECQYEGVEEVSGKTVLLRHLVEEAIAWPDLEDYPTVMGNLTTFIAAMTGTGWEQVAEQLKRVIEVQRPALANLHTHTDDCVCQQKPETIIQAVLDYLSGKTHELKWDILLSFTCQGQRLNSLAVLTFLTETEVEDDHRMGVESTGIPYGWTSDDIEYECAIPLTDFITHACTWTGGHEQQDAILDGIACLMDRFESNDEDNVEHYRQALDACYNALHNTRLH